MESMTPQERETAIMVAKKSGWSWAPKLVHLLERGDEQSFDSDIARDVQDRLDTLTEQYIHDCAASDLKPSVTDFATWMLHVKGIEDGKEMARLDIEEKMPAIKAAVSFVIDDVAATDGKVAGKNYEQWTDVLNSLEED